MRVLRVVTGEKCVFGLLSGLVRVLFKGWQWVDNGVCPHEDSSVRHGGMFELNWKIETTRLKE